MRIISLIFFLVLLTSCSSIPLKSMYKLATTDPYSLKAKEFRTAARIPNDYQVQPKSSVFSFKMVVDGEMDLQESFYLEAISDTNLLKQSEDAEKDGYQLFGFKVAEKDHARLENMRDLMKKTKLKYGDKAKGSISAGVKLCRKSDFPIQDALTTLWLHFDFESGFFPIFVDQDLAKTVDKNQLETMIPVCQVIESNHRSIITNSP